MSCRAVPAGSPDQRYVLIGEVVAPVADIIPFPGLITMMVNTLLVRQEAGQSVMFVVAGILVLYLLLGCLMDSLAMILHTILVFFPLITPPVGLNVFIINKMAGDVPISETFKGVLPFLASDLLRVTLLFAFPAISLFLIRLFP